MNSSRLISHTLAMIPAACYHAVQKARAQAYLWRILQSREAGVPVLSVGNLLMGGSGKTPFTICLAGLLQKQGFHPGIVSRGYGGSNREKFLVVSDGSSGRPLVGPSVSGDEPFLMAQRLPKVPVLIGRKRFHAVEAAQKLCGCDVVVLDDGFQHMQLARDMDIVLLNGTEDRMFPLGRLREPISGLARADLVVLVGSSASIPESADHCLTGLPAFRCCSIPVALVNDLSGEETVAASHYANQEVVLLSGIASPERFRRTAEDLQWRVLDHLIYPDHHVFSDDELMSILTRWAGDPIVTTEKDWVKLPEWFKKADRVLALRVAMAMEEEDAFWNVLQETIGRHSRRRHGNQDCK
ncbi:MAG: tetraacyldisaccharide 4'-kinase [Desulfomonilaceae bacterium]